MCKSTQDQVNPSIFLKLFNGKYNPVLYQYRKCINSTILVCSFIYKLYIILEISRI